MLLAVPMLLLDALNRKPVIHPPVWLMRQAGRYLPEYRAVRTKFPNFMEFCFNSEAAAEVTLQPITRFDLDAAIIFADILTIPHVMGHPVSFTEGEGPRVTPLTSPEQVTALADHLPELEHNLAAISHTISLTRAALAADKAVIGFSGGPFTLACYILDAKPSQGIPNLLAFSQNHPQAFHTLIQTLTQAIIRYLSQQVAAGANAVQLFESWALACPAHLWQQAVHQPLLTIAEELKKKSNTPVIAFPRGATNAQLQALAQVENNPLNALSLSTETDLAWATQTLQPHLALQGNLDPGLMLGEPTPMLAALQNMLKTATQKPGYVVNLGHGLTPQTNIDTVKALVDAVHSWR